MKTSLLLALGLPLLASALIKPKKKATELKSWMVATVEDTENVEANPSQAPFRPQFEILNTKWEVGNSKTVEVFWQRPNTTEVKGVFFGATGCFHQGGDFFEEVNPEDGWKFEACGKSKLHRCQGLPENVYAFKYARERGYLVVTVSPQGPNSCWDHDEDPARINTAINYVIKREKLPEDVPIFATGASQGGVLMFDIQSAMTKPNIMPNLKCIAPQVAAPKENFDNAHLPTMFIWMTKDGNLTVPVQTAIHKLRKKNVPVAERTPHPWKVHDLMVARGYSEKTADEVVHKLMNAKGSYGHKPLTRNGFIKDHPGDTKWWINAVRKVFPESEDSLMKDHSKFHHLMQVAYAEHEFTAEYTDHIIDFCEGHENPSAPLRFDREPILTGPNGVGKHLTHLDQQWGIEAKNQRQSRGQDAFVEVSKKAPASVNFDTQKKK